MNLKRMHTNEQRKLVSSQAAGLAARTLAVRKISSRRVWRLASPQIVGRSALGRLQGKNASERCSYGRRAIPLTSHRYQQAAAA